MPFAAFLDGHVHLVISVSRVSSIIWYLVVHYSANYIPVGHSLYTQFTRPWSNAAPEILFTYQTLPLPMR